jgi:hypothetical protein
MVFIKDIIERDPRGLESERPFLDRGVLRIRLTRFLDGFAYRQARSG